jgi:hypothetical protein
LSPFLSLDGKQIGFVESNDGFASNYTAFHVLTWKAGEGSLSGAAAPGNCAPGNSCMSTLVLSSTRSDSRSSPFFDYAHDTAYVGDDGGLLHKITPVFNGTPAEVTGNGWPVQLNSAQVQSPVYDSVSGRIITTDNGGSLYVVDATSGAILKTIPVTIFAPSENVYTGAFDNNYFTSPSSGLLYFAGSVNRMASLVAVGFTGTTMNASFSGPLLLSTNPTTSDPTPLTEIFNPSFSTAKDRLFVGIDANCTNSGTNGCVEGLDISNGFPTGILATFTLGTNGAAFSVSGIIIDNVSSAAQASSIYFEALTPTFTAIKLTQSGLN